MKCELESRRKADILIGKGAGVTCQGRYAGYGVSIEKVATRLSSTPFSPIL